METCACQLCDVAILDGDKAYGLSAGLISGAHYGFLPDDKSAWDLFCPRCMNKVDRLILEFKKANPKLGASLEKD